ncbi:hypothetical protein Sango_1926200 [Sesamum angolense]|uniref:Reverse transcriptase/retrotransposon-derived protein RNase H-like domain-containing protein n=1 Tax=Sesamum angolense TaxID=2727404 RepID=A0AAE1WDX5_9LAMI|nr:hypothetical protein Sango_1926200 [Sesamum angolense]
MDLQSSQNNYSEEDRLQTSESLSRFFSRMTVSNKTMERIMRQDSNLSPYDGFRIGGISKVLNQIGLNQRKHHIIYKVSSGEFAIPMEFTGNVMEMQLIPKEEILEELSRLREEIVVTMKWINIGTIEVPVIGRYEGMLEITGHEILVTGVAGRENGSMTLGISFLEDHKPWEEKGTDKRKFDKALLSFRQQGLIEPGISAYSSPGFLVRNHGEIKRGAYCGENPQFSRHTKQLQSFLGVVNFAGIFIKDLAKYRKDLRPLLKETESAKWKWEEIHTQRVRELKQVCNNLPKLTIPQDEDELVVYTDANDYRWAAVLMKRTTTGEEPCRYTGGLFTEQQAQV